MRNSKPCQLSVLAEVKTKVSTGAAYAEGISTTLNFDVLQGLSYPD